MSDCFVAHLMLVVSQVEIAGDQERALVFILGLCLTHHAIDEFGVHSAERPWTSCGSSLIWEMFQDLFVVGSKYVLSLSRYLQ